MNRVTIAEKMTAKARERLNLENRGPVPDPYWIAVYTKRVLCEHARIETRNNGYGNHECLDCGQAI